MYLCRPECITTKIVSWECHIDNRYDMILGRDLITAMGLYLKFPDSIVIGSERPYEGCSVPMVDVSNCNFKHLT